MKSLRYLVSKRADKTFENLEVSITENLSYKPVLETMTPTKNVILLLWMLRTKSLEVGVSQKKAVILQKIE